MSEKNNIDRLFQEKFKDFEVTPSDKVWENIQFKMNTKEKKTNLLPFWLRLCSFAAVFLIGFSVATTFIAGPFGFKNPFNSKESTTDSDSKQKSSIVTDSFENKNTNAIVKTENEKDISKFNDSNSIGSSRSDESTSSSLEDSRSNTIMSGTTADDHNLESATGKSSSRNNAMYTTAHRNRKENPVVLNNAKERNTIIVSEKNNVTANTNLSKEDKKGTTPVIVSSEITPSNNASAEITSDKIRNTAAEINTADENLKIKNSDTEFDYNATNNSKVAYESGNKHIPNKKSINFVTDSSDSAKTIAENNNTAAINNKDKSKDSITKSSGNKAVSVAVDSLTQNQKEIAEKTEEKKTEEEKVVKERNEKKSKWIVSSSFSPVYLNLNGTGSALDSKFADNAKSYQTSMSYGVGLQYALNNKWTVRTGVNALNLEYSTNNIIFYYSNNGGAGLENVNENGTGIGIVIENPNVKDIAYNGDDVVTTRYKANINHRINYIEVPLELSYKIINKKFGVDVIGGVSSIFLNDNRVSLISAVSNLNIGEANNLNKLHFSTNLGIGLRYNFMKNLQVNMEPMLKYQINTYNGDAGNFKPYFIGVYSGISFSF